MAATHKWAQYTSATLCTALGDPARFDFKANDNPSTAVVNDRITAGSNSWPATLAGYWSGTFNVIDNILFFSHDDDYTGYGTTAAIKALMTAAYLRYTTGTAGPQDWSVVPSTSGAALDLTPATTLTSAGRSRFVRLQLSTDAAGATPGLGATCGFCMLYDET